MYWIEFIIAASFIVFAGTRLTTYADKLSDKLNLGKAWIGIVLLGFITSLPEAITCVASIISLGANDLAVGNLLGSNNFNPLLIVVMDALYRRGSITNTIKPHRSQKYSAFFALALTMIVILEIGILPGGVDSALLATPVLKLGPFGFVTIGGVFVILIYFGGMKYLGLLNKKYDIIDSVVGEHDDMSSKESLTKIWLNLLICAAVVIFAAIKLAGSADTIAEQTGLGRTFVGSILLALVTSLPEMVVTISAMKLGAFDLAIGNIFGSNMTNIFIMIICGLCYTKSPILETVSNTHVLTGMLSIVITCIALVGIHSNKKKEIFSIGIDSIIMLMVFLSGTAFLYHLR